MSAIIKPRIPVINWEHPLTKGLLFDAPFYETGGAKALDLVNSIQGVIAASGATWARNKHGIDLDFSAAASGVSWTTNAKMTSLSLMSYETMFYYRGSGGGTLGRVFQHGNTGGAPYCAFFMNSGTANIEWFANHAGTTGVWTVALAINTWYHCVITYDISNTANIPIIYINGLPATVTTVTQSAGALPGDTADFYVGNSPANTRNFDGQIVYCRNWNRILTANEVRKLYANPFQIYRQPANQQALNAIAAAGFNANNAGFFAMF